MRNVHHHTHRTLAGILRGGLALGIAAMLCHCSSPGKGPTTMQAADCVVSVQEQKLAYYRNGEVSKTYPISTSKFGISDRPGKFGTPPGLLEVVAKIGHGVQAGTVFNNRKPTGEVIKPGTPGRDPIVSRIMWLRGMESQNSHAYGRCIYIHGTADEKGIGQPVSWGCIRMKSSDVITLFNKLNIGARVLIVEGPLPAIVAMAAPARQSPARSQPPLLLSPEGTYLANTSAKNSAASSANPSPKISQIKKNADGSTTVYSAQRNSSSPTVVLRSKRSASDYQKNAD